MEPAFYRGDLLFLTNYQDEPYKAGEIIVYKIRERDIPIVHRILKVHERWVHGGICFSFTLYSPDRSH
jgi:signal peptidase